LRVKRSIAVVGAGISGLSTALALADRSDHEVVVLEASDRVGGRIDASSFAGVEGLDAGADAFLARVPEALELAERVGLGPTLVSPEPVGAAVWNNGLHGIPEGLLLGLPGRLWPLATTGLLSWKGKLRAGLEPLLPRTSSADDSVGAFVRARFGDEVHERLVDSLVGSIYATDTDNFSLAEVPQIHAIAKDNRSLLLAARRQRRSAAGTGTAAISPIFAAPRGGIGSLIDATARAVTDAGAEIRTASPVNKIRRNDIRRNDEGRNWSIDGKEYDAVIFAGPAKSTGSILTEAVPEAADLLGQAETADVILVTLHISADQWPDRLHGLSGYLVPKPVQRWVTAASFGSQKWAHWRPPSGGEILRVSIGRDGMPVLQLTDTEVLDAVLTDLQTHLGVKFAPLDIRITRWPGAFAQYRPHHAAWVDSIESELPSGLFITGAGYRGIGIPACVRDGRKIGARADNFLKSM
jgi:oxygen-dependent protoporphyrinogen oxidase